MLSNVSYFTNKKNPRADFSDFSENANAIIAIRLWCLIEKQFGYLVNMAELFSKTISFCIFN